MSLGTNDVKRWENKLNEFDITKESQKANKDVLDYFGRDPFSYNPENTLTMNYYYREHEARDSHGYPGTSWLQIAICYGAGIYTAKE